MGQFQSFTSQNGFTWIDLVDPSAEELQALAENYQIAATAIDDCLDPEHLPKFEKFEDLTFLILRAYDSKASATCDTVDELTRKISIFYSEKLLISIHRVDWPFFENLRNTWDLHFQKSKSVRGPLLRALLEESLLSYEKPIDVGLTTLEDLEKSIFSAPGTRPFQISDGYFLKRQAFVYKRILRYTHDVLTKVSASGDPRVATFYQDLRETLDSIFFYADELLEGVNQLLGLHISLASQRTNEASYRTNEVVRTLTIVSLFFLPLNFLAGVYGMNFEYMPGLAHPYGFQMFILGMMVVCFFVLLWVKRKGWLD